MFDVLGLLSALRILFGLDAGDGPMDPEPEPPGGGGEVSTKGQIGG